MERPSTRVPNPRFFCEGFPPLFGGFSLIWAKTATIKEATPSKTWIKASISLICITPFLASIVVG